MGGGGSPPAPPAPLNGLTAFSVQAEKEGCRNGYCWTLRPFFDDWICVKDSSITAFIEVDPCFCKDVPLPPELESVPDCLYDIGPSGLAYWVTEDGFLEFRWREPQSLYMSTEPNRSDVERFWAMDSLPVALVLSMALRGERPLTCECWSPMLTVRLWACPRCFHLRLVVVEIRLHH